MNNSQSLMNKTPFYDVANLLLTNKNKAWVRHPKFNALALQRWTMAPTLQNNALIIHIPFNKEFIEVNKFICRMEMILNTDINRQIMYRWIE